ncbi:MAG: FkbM family methyltransferase, partial [Rhodospirillales bacterium]
MLDQHSAQSLFTQLLSLREQSKQANVDAEVQFLSFCARNHLGSQAQFFQDLLVLYLLGPKRQGYFVEFGATDGMELSNSLLLERGFDWRGILAEPATCWHEALHKNRRAKIDQRCVWSHTGEQLTFNETPQAMLSTIDRFSDRDYAAESRTGGKKYMVETVSLNDLLAQHDCPSHIDYMSIDTEGSELSILSNFDFAKYDVGIMSVEHN